MHEELEQAKVQKMDDFDKTMAEIQHFQARMMKQALPRPSST